ncbi:polysaccharide deacetylase [Tamilnaduibacter salinus]|uniref:Polysaccharide deacetylase n=1 Tax=Tamilnaduibacter salinus TaxID=1484056 RepID=A0A2A2I636_9GAMM|nr:polysaccharide deacetylase family protein [Tamilnaduibacter salinus]PAV26766.1 polysaccharide deacetylase [Tamilnaduibacter salinus]
MRLKAGRFHTGGFLVLALLSGVSHADLAILQYHHVSNDTPAATSTTPSLFRAQLDRIESLGIPVKPLKAATQRQLSGDGDDTPTVAITFDDAYSSIHETAAPILLERGMPFTVFVNTQPVDEGRQDSMSWDQLRELADHELVTIANHSADHAHLPRRPGETESAWRKRVTDSLDKAYERLETEIGERPGLFAYPYGEYDAATEALVRNRGWLGYGQHSGPVGETSGQTRLPRFPMATAYGQLDTLPTKLRSLALPVPADSLPDSVVDSNPPSMTLALPDGFEPARLTCYGSGRGKLPTIRTDGGSSVTVQADTAFDSRRFRYNCTYPAGDGRFYWLSQQWTDLSQPED